MGVGREVVYECALLLPWPWFKFLYVASFGDYSIRLALFSIKGINCTWSKCVTLLNFVFHQKECK